MNIPNPAFEADFLQNSGANIPISSLGVAGLTALGFDAALLPSSFTLLPWHKDILQTVFNKLAPSPAVGEQTQAPRRS
jgi:hypothetical protein